MYIISAIIFYTIGWLVGNANIGFREAFFPLKYLIRKKGHRHKWVIEYDDTLNFNGNVGMQIFGCICGAKNYTKISKGKKSDIEILEKNNN